MSFAGRQDLLRARRGAHASLGAALAVVVATAACEFTETRRRRSGRSLGEPASDVATGDGTVEVPRESVAGVVHSAPVDLGTSQCPGSRVLRVDRRWAPGIDAGGLPPPPPRYYGLDEYGHVVSLSDILACELRAMHFVEKGLAEGANLIMHRGARIADPDGDCEWREPWRSERYGYGDGGVGSRRVFVHEHCRRRGGVGPSSRVVTIEIPASYAPIVIR